MKTALKYRYILNMAIWWDCISRRGGGRDGEGALMSNLSPSWYDEEKLTIPGSSNLNLRFLGAQQKV